MTQGRPAARLRKPDGGGRAAAVLPQRRPVAAGAVRAGAGRLQPDRAPRAAGGRRRLRRPAGLAVQPAGHARARRAGLRAPARVHAQRRAAPGAPWALSSNLNPDPNVLGCERPLACTPSDVPPLVRPGLLFHITTLCPSVLGCERLLACTSSDWPSLVRPVSKRTWLRRRL